MKLKNLNRAFIEACEKCPQFNGFDDEQDELVNGSYVRVAKLHKKGIEAILKYWKNDKTIGGNIINNFGYSEELSQEVLKLMQAK